jgi:hypothetical protein
MGLGAAHLQTDGGLVSRALAEAAPNVLQTGVYARVGKRMAVPAPPADAAG